MRIFGPVSTDRTSEPLLVTVEELRALYLPTHARSRIYELAQAKEIPHIREGNRLYFRPESIRKWIEEREEGGK